VIQAFGRAFQPHWRHRSQARKDSDDSTHTFVALPYSWISIRRERRAQGKALPIVVIGTTPSPTNAMTFMRTHSPLEGWLTCRFDRNLYSSSRSSTDIHAGNRPYRRGYFSVRAKSPKHSSSTDYYSKVLVQVGLSEGTLSGRLTSYPETSVAFLQSTAAYASTSGAPGHDSGEPGQFDPRYLPRTRPISSTTGKTIF
jgi:hypothetical protein